jgi:spermidine synthase
MASIRLSEQAGVRYLQFGPQWIQGAMRLRRPWSLELEYTRQMMAPLLLRAGEAWPRSVLQVGLGAGSFTRFLHRSRPRARLTAVEIDPEVALAAWTFFELPPESARFRVEIGDACDYVATTRQRFDLILVDGFDAAGRAGALDRPPFYRHCRARLSARGMMAVNLLGKRADTWASVGRIGRAFDGRVLALPPRDANRIAIAATGPTLRATVDSLRAAAARLKADTGLDLRAQVPHLVHARGDARELSL